MNTDIGYSNTKRNMVCLCLLLCLGLCKCICLSVYVSVSLSVCLYVYDQMENLETENKEWQREVHSMRARMQIAETQVLQKNVQVYICIYAHM